MCIDMASKKKKVETNTKLGSKKQFVANMRELLNNRSLSCSPTSRQGLAALLGSSYGGNRNLYTVLGYKTVLNYRDYLAYYTRMGIATKVIDMPVNATWKDRPEVTDSQEDESLFDKAWEKIIKDQNLNVFNKFTRLDKLAGIGGYAVLFLGFAGSRDDLDKEVTKGSELLYIQPYSKQNAEPLSYEMDTSSPRFGLPVLWTIKTEVNKEIGKATVELKVHWTRILHNINNPLENDQCGTPELESVYNFIQNLETVSGGSAEMYWRGAFPGWATDVKDDYELSTTDADAMADEMDEYYHGLRRLIRSKGVNLDKLAPDVEDPDKFVNVQMELIAGSKGIPKRMLVGSERGELASTDDKNTWNDLVKARRENHAEPSILRPFVDRLIEYGTLPEPEGGEYMVGWSDLWALGEKEKSDIALNKSKAIKEYMTALGADQIIPPDFFLQEILDLTPEQMEMLHKMLITMVTEEEINIDEFPDEFPEEEEEQA